MNPLEHFGIKNQFIRGDTKSYDEEIEQHTHSWKRNPRTIYTENTDDTIISRCSCGKEFKKLSDYQKHEREENKK